MPAKAVAIAAEELTGKKDQTAKHYCNHPRARLDIRTITVEKGTVPHTETKQPITKGKA
jgi:hypothetical protein